MSNSHECRRFGARASWFRVSLGDSKLETQECVESGRTVA
jgi:hypothetical protein